MSNIILGLQVCCTNTKIPKRSDFRKWLNFILTFYKKVKINIRIVDKNESRYLNFLWRKRNYPTNILSFSFEEFDTIKKLNKIKYRELGDLVVCAPLVNEEAYMQEKSITEHWAHIIIHGSLHLIGFNHNSSKQVKNMELLESKIMVSLGFSDPYIM